MQYAPSNVIVLHVLFVTIWAAVLHSEKALHCEKCAATSIILLVKLQFLGGAITQLPLLVQHTSSYDFNVFME